MNRKIMPKRALPDWITELVNSYRVIGPKPIKGQYVFDEANSILDFDLDYPTSILPPKKIIMPPREKLIDFDNQENRVEPVIVDEPTVVLGVHTCDLHAINMLDGVFRQHYVDQHYQARRANIILVSIECLQPCTEHSFCKDMGTLSVPEWFDLHLTDLGDSYIVDVGSERGRELIQKGGHFNEPSLEDRQRYNRVISKKWSRFPYRLRADLTELPSLLSLSYKFALWGELGQRCLGCGMCTLVCPTCYCFDVIDDVDLSLNRGSRSRVWDSCQLNLFARVAGGHDFRPGQANRQRHRFLRKYKYQSAAPGLLGCVGCGRCAQTCLVDITPVEVLNKLYVRRLAYNNRNQQEALSG